MISYSKRPESKVDTAKDKSNAIGDKYIINLIDSTPAYYIDTLLNSHIDIEHYVSNDTKKCKVYSIKTELLFSDGSTFPIHYTSDKLFKDKKCIAVLNNNKKVSII